MKRLVLIAGLCMPLLGCSVIGEGWRTLVTEPLTYCARWEEHRSLERYRRWANDAWAKIEGDQAGRFSKAYACGFKDGFVDYLDAGGNGEPPPLPPRKYWGAEHQTPAGQAAIRDWFAGFRHGAAVAWQSGARQCVTVPPSVAVGCASGRCPTDQAVPTPMPGPAASTPPATEFVPAPPRDAQLPPGAGPPSVGPGAPAPDRSPWPRYRVFPTAIPGNPISPAPNDVRQPGLP